MKQTLFAISMTIITFWLFTFPGKTFADGKFAPEVNIEYPDIPSQRAIVKYKDNTETLVIESTLNGEGNRFGWIIPVPNKLKKIEKFTPGLIQTLSFQLKPFLLHRTKLYGSIYLLLLLYLICSTLTLIKKTWISTTIMIIVSSIVIAFTCLPNFISYGSGSIMQVVKDVEISQHDFIGNFEVYTLKAKNHSDLNTWLKKNNYKPFEGRDLTVIDNYIKHNWYFFAAKLVRRNGKVSAPHPVLLEFESKQPIYPVQLTVSKGASLFLELYMIADKELSPKNYPLKKEYCNYFVHKEINSEMYLFKQDRIKQKKIFWSGMFENREDCIGHPDAEKILWDGCVVTKLSGTLSESQVKDDIYFNAKNRVRYISTYLSTEAVAQSGVGNVNYFFIAAIISLLILRGKKNISFRKILMINFILLPLIGAGIFLITYLSVDNKVNVKYASRVRHERNFFSFGWNISDMLSSPLPVSMFSREVRYNSGFPYHWGFSDLTGHINSIFAIPPSDYWSDDEILKALKSRKDPPKNIFTGNDLIIEDSPGNFTIRREDGAIRGITFYTPSGIPIDML